MFCDSHCRLLGFAYCWHMISLGQSLFFRRAQLRFRYSLKRRAFDPALAVAADFAIQVALAEPIAALVAAKMALACLARHENFNWNPRDLNSRRRE